MRRCFTPNPHTKTSMLSDLVGGQTQTKNNSFQIDYDSFIFVDRVTKDKICIGEAKNKYGTKPKKNSIFTKPDKKLLSSRGKPTQQNRQIQQINECWNFMKTTKLFQMQSLKSKILTKNKDNENKENSGYDDMNKKKKNLREFLEKYIHEINVKEFRNYVEKSDSTGKRFNQKIINLWKHVPSKLNRHNMCKIIQQILQSEQKVEKKVKGQNISIQDIHFPDQQKIQTILMNHAFVKNRQFEYLVQPNYKNNTKQTLMRKKRSRNHPKFVYKSKLEQYKFQESNFNAEEKVCGGFVNNWMNDGNKEKPKFLNDKQKNLIIAVENGLIYDVLYLLVQWPVLLNTIDQKGNNLLHIAAKKNQFDIYDILLKKMGLEGLQKKNVYGKTPIQLAKIFNSIEIIARNKQLQGYL